MTIAVYDDAGALLAELRAAGLSVSARDGKLLVTPAGKLTAGQRDRVKALKPILLSLLTGIVAAPPPARPDPDTQAPHPPGDTPVPPDWPADVREMSRLLYETYLASCKGEPAYGGWGDHADELLRRGVRLPERPGEESRG